MTIKKIHTFWEDTAKVWLHEHLEMFRDEGALLFVILLPLAYPLLYSWIYNNEVVRRSTRGCCRLLQLCHKSRVRASCRRVARRDGG